MRAQYLEDISKCRQQSSADLPVHAFFVVSSVELALLLVEKVVQDWPVLFEIIIRHAETARSTDLVYIYNNDAPSSRKRLDFVLFDKVVEVICPKFQYSAYLLLAIFDGGVSAYEWSYLCPIAVRSLAVRQTRSVG